jgi:hypothetical protein
MKKMDEKKVHIKTLTDLVNLNLETLEDVVSGETDNRKAAVIFTGSRTITGALKLGLEAAKLGVVDVGGIVMTDLKQLPEVSTKAKKK